MHYSARLVAYEPGGALLGELPQPLSWEAAMPLGDTPSLKLTYSKFAVGADLLERPVEIAVLTRGPGSDWVESWDSRFLVVRQETERLDAAGSMTFIAPGLLWLMNKVQVYPLSKDYVEGQVADANRSEREARGVLLDREEALRKALKLKDNATVSYGDSSPSSNTSIWVDTTNESAPVVKAYNEKTREWVATAASSSRAKALHSAWAAHQVTQSDVREVEDKGRLSKRVFTNMHPGAIMATLLAEATARGSRLKGVDWGFSAKADSSGNAWPKWTGTLELNVGTSLLKVYQAFAEAGHLDMRTRERDLYAYPQEAAMLRRRESQVVLRHGVDIAEAPDKSTMEGVAGEVLFLGEEGLNFNLTNPEAPTPWGVWEEAVVQSNVRTAAAGRLLARRALESASATRVERTRELVFSSEQGPKPLVNYLVGDYVSAPNSQDALEPQRVMQITLTYDGQKGVVSGNLVLNDRFLEREIRNRRRTEQVLGASGSAGTGGTRANPSYVDLRTPESPELVLGEGTTYAAARGGYESLIRTTWYWSEMATNGTYMGPDGVAYHQVRYRMFQEGDAAEGLTQWFYPPHLEGDLRETVLGPLEAINPTTRHPAIYEIQVRTFGINGKVSSWSRSTRTQVPLDDTPPEPPSTPTVEHHLSVISVIWDGGNNQGGQMPLDFSHIRIQEALDVEGVPPSALTWTELNTPQMDPIIHEAMLTGRPYGETYRYRLVAVDFAGNRSDPSEASEPITVTSAVDTAAIQEALDAALAESEAAQAELTRRLNEHANTQAQLALDMATVRDKAAAAEAAANKAKADLAAAEARLEQAEAEIEAHTADLGTFSETLTDLDAKASDAVRDAAEASDRAQSAADEAAEARAALDILIKSSSSLLIGGDYEQEASYQQGRRKSLADPYSGSYALELPTDSYVYVMHPQVGANPGMQLRGSFMVKQSAGSAGNAAPDIILRVIKMDGSHAYLYPTEKTAPPLSSQWQEYVFEYNALPDDTRLIEPWIRNGFSTVSGGTAKIYIDWATLVDVGSYKAAVELAEAAQAAAEAAALTANNALSKANLAGKSADGKTTTTYTLNSPRGVGLVAGDTHYRMSSLGSDARIMQQWRWSGSEWAEQKVDGQQVVNFDAGYITSGFLDVANRIRAGSIYADKMVVGIGENLIPWTHVLQGVQDDAIHRAHGAGANLKIQNTVNAGGNHLLVDRPGTDNGTWAAVIQLGSGGQHTNGNGREFPLIPGRQYRVQAQVALGGSYTYGYPQARLFVGLRDSADAGIGSEYGAPVTPAWSPQTLSMEFTAPASAASMHLMILTDRPGMLRVINPDLREMTDGSLIVNGTIEGKHVAAESVAAKIGEFVKVKASNMEVTGEFAGNVVTMMDAKAKNLIVTGNASLNGETWIKNLTAAEIKASKVSTDQLTAGSASINEGVVEKLWSDVITARKIHASQVLIGSGPNLAVNGKGEMGDNTNWSNFSTNVSSSLNDQIGVSRSWWTTSTSGLTLDQPVLVDADSQYRLTVHTAAQFAGQVVYLELRCLDNAGVDLGRPSVIYGTGRKGTNFDGTGYAIDNQTLKAEWEKWEAHFKTRPGTASVLVRMYSNHRNGVQNEGQWTRWAGLSLTAKVSDSLIVNGSITSDSLASLAITTDKLAANAVTADKIDVGSVRAKVMSSDAFIGKTFTGGTFTGSIFRSSSSGARVQFDSTGIRAFDQYGKTTFRVYSSNGDVEMTGDFATEFQGSLGQIQINANKVTHGGADLGIWWANAAGQVRTQAQSNSSPGIWVSNNNQDAGRRRLQLRSEDDVSVYVWSGIRLGKYDGGTPWIGSNLPIMFESEKNSITVKGDSRVQIRADDGSVEIHSGNMAVLRPYNRTYLGSGRAAGTGDGSSVSLGDGSGYNWSAGHLNANVHLNGSGQFWKTTSQSAAKLDQVREVPDDSFMDLEVTSWLDRASWELAQTHSTKPAPMTEAEADEYERALRDLQRRSLGFIAEEAVQTSAEPLVERNAEGLPVNFDYARLGVLMLPYLRLLWDDYKSRTGMPKRKRTTTMPRGPLLTVLPTSSELPDMPSGIWHNNAPRPAQGFGGIVPPDRSTAPVVN